MLKTNVDTLARQHAALKQDGYLLLSSRDSPDELIKRLGRVGQPVLLRPTDRDHARRWSLSGTFGRGTFPWHTDGAISSYPPHWLVLRPVSLSEATATELLNPSADLRDRLGRTVLLAKDCAGRARYLPALISTEAGYRIRWDPRTCRSRSMAVAKDIAEAMPTLVVTWEMGVTLVIDNYKLLHRRPAVSAATQRILERIYVWNS